MCIYANIQATLYSFFEREYTKTLFSFY